MGAFDRNVVSKNIYQNFVFAYSYINNIPTVTIQQLMSKKEKKTD